MAKHREMYKGLADMSVIDIKATSFAMFAFRGLVAAQSYLAERKLPYAVSLWVTKSGEILTDLEKQKVDIRTIKGGGGCAAILSKYAGVNIGSLEYLAAEYIDTVWLIYGDHENNCWVLAHDEDGEPIAFAEHENLEKEDSAYQLFTLGKLWAFQHIFGIDSRNNSESAKQKRKDHSVVHDWLIAQLKKQPELTATKLWSLLPDDDAPGDAGLPVDDLRRFNKNLNGELEFSGGDSDFKTMGYETFRQHVRKIKKILFSADGG